jgi:ankyrin repeat protein
MWAASQGHLEAAGVLVDHGADLELTAADGNTPLIFAATQGHTEMVGMLIDRGADPDAQSRGEGRTALMVASSAGHQDVVALLLDRGANASATDNEGYTAEGQALTEEIKCLLRVRPTGDHGALCGVMIVGG